MYKQNTQCSGNTKTASKQTGNRVFATSILPFWSILHSNFGTSHRHFIENGIKNIFP